MKITIIRYSQRDGRKKKIDHTSRRRKQIFLFSLIDWEYKTQVGKKNIPKYCEMYYFLKLRVIYHYSSLLSDNQNTPTNRK